MGAGSNSAIGAHAHARAPGFGSRFETRYRKLTAAGALAREGRPGDLNPFTSTRQLRLRRRLRHCHAAVQLARGHDLAMGHARARPPLQNDNVAKGAEVGGVLGGDAHV